MKHLFTELSLYSTVLVSIMSSEVPKKYRKGKRSNNRIQQFIYDIIQTLYMKPFNMKFEAAHTSQFIQLKRTYCANNLPHTVRGHNGYIRYTPYSENVYLCVHMITYFI